MGLVEQARAKYALRNSEAVIVGDSYQADMQCAQNAGLVGIHVATGRGSANPLPGKHDSVEVADRAIACLWIINRH
ncbi:MAG: HAD hydrolase-like protein [Schleiferilactobacillus harbinensis]|jgi:D-glycero-D-manno-heptose 1,7-bisphosphate phosphatase|nr:HAD hydrolase-like protein [Schleiferilactobacillus harbinensis]